MTIKDWKIKLKKLTATKGVDRLRMEFAPFRDWRVVVAVFFATFAISLVFNIYVASEANRDTLFSAAPKSVGVIKFNEEGLVKVVEQIDKKAARFDAAETEEITLVDPSVQDW